MPIKAKRMEKSLIKKGFIANNGGKHKVFLYAPDDKITSIRVNMSHDGKELGDQILSYMVGELKLQNKRMLEDLANCPLSREQLYNYYKEKSLI